MGGGAGGGGLGWTGHPGHAALAARSIRKSCEAMAKGETKAPFWWRVRQWFRRIFSSNP